MTDEPETDRPGELLPNATPDTSAQGSAQLKDFHQRLDHRKYTFWGLAVACCIFFAAILIWPMVLYCHYSGYEITPKEITLFGIWFAGYGAIGLSLMLSLARLVETPEVRKAVDIKSLTSPLYEAVKAVATAIRDALKKSE